MLLKNKRLKSLLPFKKLNLLLKLNPQSKTMLMKSKKLAPLRKRMLMRNLLKRLKPSSKKLRKKQR
jgi:hypothetical protein